MDSLALIGIASTLALMVLVVAQELLNASRSAWARLGLRLVNIGMLPLLIAFGFAASVKFVEAALRPSTGNPGTPAPSARALEPITRTSDRTVTAPGSRVRVSQPAAARVRRFHVARFFPWAIAGSENRVSAAVRPQAALKMFATRLGRPFAAVEVARASVERQDGASARLDAYRVRGAKTDALVNAFLRSRVDGGRYHRVLEHRTIAGKDVQVALHRRNAERSIYLYTYGDTLFAIQTADAGAASAILRTLP